MASCGLRMSMVDNHRFPQRPVGFMSLSESIILFSSCPISENACAFFGNEVEE